MKKLLLFAAIAAFTFTTANAQSEFRIGFKGGVNFASVGGDFTDNSNGRTSFHIGGLVEIPIMEKLAVQPELMYSSLGNSNEDSGSESYGGLTYSYKEESDLKLDYISIPIMAKYYIIDGLSVEAGPQVSILIKAESEYDYSETVSGGGETISNSESGTDDVKELFKTLDLGFGIGGSYRLDFGLFFSARYVIGLSNVNDFNNYEIEDLEDFYDGKEFKNTNNVLQLSVGYSF